MRKTIFTMLTIATLLNAEGGCTLVQSNDMNVTWKAYKTLAKLCVAGQFTGVSYTAIIL